MTAQPKGRLQSAGAVAPLGGARPPSGGGHARSPASSWGTPALCDRKRRDRLPDALRGDAVFAGGGADPRVRRRGGPRGAPPPARRNYGGVLLLGLVQTTAQYVFFYVGLANTTGSRGSIIDASAAFIGVILAHYSLPGGPHDPPQGPRLRGRVRRGGRAQPRRRAGRGVRLYRRGVHVLPAATSSALGAVVSARVAPGNDPMAVTGSAAAGRRRRALPHRRARRRAHPPHRRRGLAPAFSILARALGGGLHHLDAAAQIPSGGAGEHLQLPHPRLRHPLSGALPGRGQIWNVRNLAALLLVCAGICIVNGAPGPASSVKA